MAHIGFVRPKVDVKIKLYPQDMRDILTQPEVLAGFTTEELKMMTEAFDIELNARSTGENNG